MQNIQYADYATSWETGVQFPEGQ